MAVTWEELEQTCLNCRKCVLAEERTRTVLGRGNRNAPLLLVGEGPGRQEDEQGLPFVGQAGQLMDLVLTALDFKPEEYYIANVVKCRPPGNRTPFKEECDACLPYLRAQFMLIRPKIVLCMGNVALTNLISSDARITKMRGIWTEKKGVLFTATYHPAALLRDESKKLDFWRDMKTVREKLNELASVSSSRI